MSEQDLIVGIDLGTTNSVVGAHVGSEYQVLSDDMGARIHPSVVSYHPNGRVLVGQTAKQRRVIDPKNTVYSVKRIIGFPYTAPRVTEMASRVAYEIVPGANDQPLVSTRGGQFAITEISALVLGKMREVAESSLGRTVSSAVVTVPANFGDAQRSATATAGAIAGLQICQVLNEPTAAALAYGHKRNLEEVIAVYDFGGGTFDVTLLQVKGAQYQVLGTAGNSFLGGDDIDERLVDLMVERFLSEERIDLRNNELSMQRLRSVAEQAKIELSRRKKAFVMVEEIAYGKSGTPLNLEVEIYREQLVERCGDVVSRTFPVCEEALALAGISASSVDSVLLVGGQTKMPLVREEVAAFFERMPRADINPDEAVALGAAIQARAIGKSNFNRTLQGTAVAAEKKPNASTLPLGLRGRVDGGVRQATRGQHHDSIETPTPSKKRTTTSPGAAVARIVPRRVGSESDAGDFDEQLTKPAEAFDNVALPEPDVELPVPTQVHRERSGRALTSEIEVITDDDAGLDDDLLEEVTGELDTSHLLDNDAVRATTHNFVPDEASTAPIDSADQEAPTRDVPINPVVPPVVPTADPEQITLMPQSEPPPYQRQSEPPPYQRQSEPPPYQRQSEPPQYQRSDAPASRSTEPGVTPARRPRSSTIMPTVIDVTPRGLGVSTVGGFCEELIGRNRSIPAEAVRVFTNSQDNQELVRIQVCQGESRKVADNQRLGVLELSGLTPRPRGATQIEVSFRVDESGILHVTARDAETGKEQIAHLRVTGAAQSLEEIQSAQQRFSYGKS